MIYERKLLKNLIKKSGQASHRFITLQYTKLCLYARPWLQGALVPIVSLKITTFHFDVLDLPE